MNNISITVQLECTLPDGEKYWTQATVSGLTREAVQRSVAFYGECCLAAAEKACLKHGEER